MHSPWVGDWVVYGRVGTAQLVGRAEELGVLIGAVERIGDPDAPTCVVVTGEAGIGKSRLLAAMADHVSASGARVLRGACLELSAALPYGPVIDVLDQLAAEDGVHNVRELAGGWVGGLDAVLPMVDPGAADVGDVTGAQQRLFQAVATVLIALAKQRPTIAQIEDLQWADQSTLDLLTFLVYRAAGSRLLVAATVRDEGLSDEEPVRSVMASWQRSRRSAMVPLRGLERHDVDELISRIRGQVPSDAEVARIHELTGGNPFLVEELLAAGALDDERVVSALTRHLLGHRLARLDPPARRLMRLVAVGGARVDQDLLVQVAGSLPRFPATHAVDCRTSRRSERRRSLMVSTRC